MIYKSLLITTLILSSSFSLELDNLDSVNENLTLNKAVTFSVVNDPWLLGNKYSQKAVELNSAAVGSYDDPKITIGALNLPVDGFDFNQEGMTQLKIGISQMFPRGDSLEIKQDQLKLNASQFPHQREDRKSKVTVQVSHLWLDIYKAQESIALIQKNRSLFEQLVDVAESSYSTTIGKTRQQDIIRAQLELSRLDDRLTILKQKKEVFITSLYEWLYNFSNEELQSDNLIKSLNLILPKKLPDIIMINPKYLSTHENPTDLLERFKNHPSVKNIDQKIKVVSKGIQLAKQKYKPQFGINTSYGYRDADLVGKNRTDLFSIGVTFDIPIFTENKQDKELQAAILKTKSIKSERWLQLRKLMSSFQTTKVNLERLKARDNLYKSKLIPQINEQAEASLTAYTNDDGDFSEVVRSRIAQLNTIIDALNISVEIQKNIVKYNYLFITKSNEILEMTNRKGDNS